MSQNKKARLIAFYLPQFHPIPENDNWWGRGFTEWTNVTKAKPLFTGHVQPKLPEELGFYDLRIPEVRKNQADLAREHGIEGFCYWHYWLGDGKRILEMPFNEVLNSGEPDFPFCLGWANHDWVGKGFMGDDHKCLIKQEYPGHEDYLRHFDFLMKAFSDKRYITFNDKPILLIYRPNEIPNNNKVFDLWRTLAIKNGFAGLHIIGDTPGDTAQLGLDGCLYSGQRHLKPTVYDKKSIFLSRKKPLKKVKYKDVIPHLLKPNGYGNTDYPVLIPNWDTSPRIQEDAIIFYDNHPEYFRTHIKQTLEAVRKRNYEDNLIFVRAWNEWAEGNYLEPDQEFGRGYLEVLKQEIFKHE